MSSPKGDEERVSSKDDNESGIPSKDVLWAAEKNEMEVLRRLLEEDRTLVNSIDKDLYTPLHRACYNNHAEVIKVLLSYGANVAARTMDGWEPLHCACQWDSVEAASLLLHNGANVNALTNGNISPLHLATSRPNGRRTIELLLWHPYVNPDLENNNKDKPYDNARRYGPFVKLFEILDKSINIY